MQAAPTTAEYADVPGQCAVAWGWSRVMHQCHTATSVILILLRTVSRLGCMRTFAQWQALRSACLGSSVSYLGLHQFLGGNIPQSKAALLCGAARRASSICSAVARWLTAVQVLVSLLSQLPALHLTHGSLGPFPTSCIPAPVSLYQYPLPSTYLCWIILCLWY